MAVEAVNMYMLFVRVWDSHIHLFLVKASIIAWGKSIKDLMIENAIDDLHISHNASGMEANIRVLLIAILVVTAHWLSVAWSSCA